MPTTKVKQGGAFKTVTAMEVKQGGVWKSVLTGSVKQGGAWKPFFQRTYNLVISSNTNKILTLVFMFIQIIHLLLLF